MGTVKRDGSVLQVLAAVLPATQIECVLQVLAGHTLSAKTRCKDLQARSDKLRNHRRIMKLISRTLKPLALTAILAGSTLTFNTARAQDAPAEKPNPVLQTPQGKAAYQLLKESAAAYRALNSYSSEVISEVKDKAALHGRVLWQRPDQLMVEMKDGKATQRYFVSGRKLTQVENDGEEIRYSLQNADTSAQYDAWQMFIPDLSIERLLNGIDGLQYSSDFSLEPYIKTVIARNAKPDEVKGLDEVDKELQVVEIKMEFLFDKATKLETKTYILSKADKLVRRYSNFPSDGENFKHVESYTNVKINPPLNVKNLVFVPTAEAKLVSSDPDEPPRYNPALKVGAAPLELKATDLQGQPISFDDYKGKVVLVDFWATWCGPCRDEMPNVIAAYQKYHEQGFDIIGVSFDQDKAPLDKYIADNKMPWRQVLGEQDQNQAATEPFAVAFIPFAMLIGRDGKIAALNVRGEALDEAIATALAK